MKKLVIIEKEIRDMNPGLKIKRNGKYYQIGYYNKGRWNCIKQLGTPEKILKTYNVPLPETYQTFKREKLQKRMKRYQKRIDVMKGTSFEQIT